MSLRRSKGNMYDWTSHTHNYIRGRCPHLCSYCYTQTGYPAVKDKYSGPLEFDYKELSVSHNVGWDQPGPKTIFICHMTDLFCEAMPREYIDKVLAHCCGYPAHTYVFQSKNPARMIWQNFHFPPHCIFGTTLESDTWHDCMGESPVPCDRAIWFQQLPHPRFITIEPILDFNVDEFVEMLLECEPDFICIGADSKENSLPEPPKHKVEALLNEIERAGIEIRAKHNLERLLDE